ncbi:MAG: hypothetical protein JWM40_1416 [Frankiales bacterium]|nr:hypothetical protein [Frankiales bacterium]
MSEALFFEFASGVDADKYHAVNGNLGLDPVAGTGDWPAGLISHTGGSLPGGGFMVFEVWESKQLHEAWMSRLGPALGQAGVPDPTRLEWLDVAGDIRP